MKQYIMLLLLCVGFVHGYAQSTVSGQVKEKKGNTTVPFAGVVLLSERDSAFVAGTVTAEDGRFSLADVSPGNYVLVIGYTGYQAKKLSVVVGTLNRYLEIGTVYLEIDAHSLDEVVVSGKTDEVASRLDKKTFSISDNITQSGSSVLEAMKNLPGITIQDGKVQLRGNDKVVVLLDGRQTALTGFGSQSGLDNIPASAIERVEIINNPTARYDANGNAGIINIIYKKEKKEGFNGKIGLIGGLGALWVKQQNLPGIGAQYQATPKANPSLMLSYRKKKVAVFLQADDLYTHTLNKNEFVDRYYDNGQVVRQQTRRNRNTNVVTVRSGIDWNVSSSSTVNVSGLFSSEKIMDHGQEPFFNADLSQRARLWQFLEDELKTTATAVAGWQYRFRQPGRLFSAGFSYTYHRENEQYFFNNIMPGYTGMDSFKLISDEHVTDLNLDYVQPFRYGRVETGLKFRRRYIPVNMLFIPGLNSPLDTNAGGWANYTETIPAVYGNYIFESKQLEVEAGLRVEYVKVLYDVNPGHNTYKSDGYNYTQPFPNLRMAYKISENNRLSLFCNRRVDRPNEVDIRIFPKYDDAEIIKVGNPALRPQFTNTIELGYKHSFANGYFYAALYNKTADATITRIATMVPGSTLIYNVYQNAGLSHSTGTELLFSRNMAKWGVFNININAWQNSIDAFTVVNLYPKPVSYAAAKQELFSGNVKLNGVVHLLRKTDLQLTIIYLAPDIVPQGRTNARFSADIGLKKSIQNGKGELFVNATDIANTLRIQKEVQGDGFRYVATDYYETQVVRVGYTYKF